MRRRRWLSSTSHVLPICTLGSASGLTCSAGGPTVKGLSEKTGVCSCKGGTRVPPLPGCPAGCARAGCPCRSLCIAKACPACKRMWLGTHILEASLSPDAPRKGLQEDGRIECGAISQVPVPEFFPYLQSICSFKGTNMFV